MWLLPPKTKPASTGKNVRASRCQLVVQSETRIYRILLPSIRISAAHNCFEWGEILRQAQMCDLALWVMSENHRKRQVRFIVRTMSRPVPGTYLKLIICWRTDFNGGMFSKDLFTSNGMLFSWHAPACLKCCMKLGPNVWIGKIKYCAIGARVRKCPLLKICFHKFHNFRRWYQL